MAAPNIVSVTSIYGKTAFTNLSNTTATSLLANAGSSGKVLKVSGILATNTEGTSVNVSCTVYVTRSATNYHLAKNVTVPALASYEVFQKDGTPLYLEEGDELFAQSGHSSGYLSLMTTYEEIS